MNELISQSIYQLNLYFTNIKNTSVPKFHPHERSLIQTNVATLSIKRLSDAEIIQEIFDKTNKTVTKQSLCNIRNRIKRESAKSYSQLRQSEYEYLYEFKERISEILDLQRRHYQILDSEALMTAKQASLIALHKLNVTLANYYNIVPYLTVTGQRQKQAETETQRNTDQV